MDALIPETNATTVATTPVPLWHFEYVVKYSSGYIEILKYQRDCPTCAQVWAHADASHNLHGVPEKIIKHVRVGGRLIAEFDFPRDYPRLPSNEGGDDISGSKGHLNNNGRR